MSPLTACVNTLLPAVDDLKYSEILPCLLSNPPNRKKSNIIIVIMYMQGIIKKGVISIAKPSSAHKIPNPTVKRFINTLNIFDE
jgi:hypothetical protein